MSMKQARWLIATFIVLAILSYVWGRNPGHLRPAQPVSGPLTEVAVPKDCALKGSGCLLSLPGMGQVRVQAPAVIRPLKKFSFMVEPQGDLAKSLGSVGVNFQMVGMDMGFNDYTLQREASGRYAQKIILPVCTSSRTDWVAELRLQTTKGAFVAKIPFEVDRRAGSGS